MDILLTLKIVNNVTHIFKDLLNPKKILWGWGFTKKKTLPLKGNLLIAFEKLLKQELSLAV